MQQLTAFDIFLLNYKFSNNLEEIRDLSRLSRISKNALDLTINALKQLRINYLNGDFEYGKEIPIYKIKNTVCMKCKRSITNIIDPFSRQPRCKECSIKCLNITDTRQKYNLQDIDLDYLNYKTIYVKEYRMYSILYSEDDIQLLCILLGDQLSISVSDSL